MPGGTGYLAEFADPAKVWAVLDAARTVVRECDCAEYDRLACHKCLLPFAPQHDLDRVSRKTAARVLDHLLGVDGDAEPDRDWWLRAVAEGTAGKPDIAPESPLEKEFYVAFVERLRAMGATVKETPGTYGPSATITLPGKKIRTWKLTPQVHMANSKPDFELATNDPDVPRIAIFADGRKFHAGPGDRNRVADDATKRAILRDSGHLVWSFGHEDLQRFKDGESAQPAWLTEQAASNTMKAGNLRPAIVKQLATDPITTLLAFITDPDREAWESVGKWLPMAFVRADNRSKGEGSTITANALTLLDGRRGSFGEGTDMCWFHTDGPLAVTASMHPGTRTISAVLVVDDRDDQLEIHDGRAWKEWLRLSNWLGLSDNHHVTTRSLIEAGASAPVAKPSAELTPDWQAVYDSTVSDAEKQLVIALAAAELPVPIVGYETDDGEVVDFAWGDVRIGVLLDPNDDAANTMSESGWTLCPPDAERIAAALQNGTA